MYPPRSRARLHARGLRRGQGSIHRLSPQPTVPESVQGPVHTIARLHARKAEPVASARVAQIARIEPLGRLVPGALRHRPGLFARPQGHSPQALVPRVHRSSARGPGDPAAPMLWLMHTKRASVQAKRRGYTPPPPTDADEDSVEGGFLPLENECTPARGEEDASKGAEDEGA